MPELRHDPIQRRWVIIATERARRPSDFSHEAASTRSAKFDPFVPGNEDQTPPELFVVGVVPQSVEYGIGLSDEVRAAVPAVISAVIEELARLGQEAAPRDPPAEPDIWWERQP